MSEWISVEDAMPEAGQSVWVYRNTKIDIDCERFQSDKWDGWDWTYVDDVTHWMPLPEPPK